MEIKALFGLAYSRGINHSNLMDAEVNFSDDMVKKVFQDLLTSSFLVISIFCVVLNSSHYSNYKFYCDMGFSKIAIISANMFSRMKKRDRKS